MPDYMRRFGWAVLICSGTAAAYVAGGLSGAASIPAKPSWADARSGCTEAMLDRNAGQTRLGACSTSPLRVLTQTARLGASR